MGEAATSRGSGDSGGSGGLRDASRGKRLQKVLAEAGVASRRECEKIIEDGRVTVNGTRVKSLPAWADPATDRIEVDGEPIARPKQMRAGGKHGGETRHVYVALHKPRRVISTARDPEGRPNVVEIVDLPRDLAARVYPVGRLDADSTGLILLTNDGELANRLTHPRYGVTKQYAVSIKGWLSDEDIERLKKGVYLAAPGARRSGTLSLLGRGQVEGQASERGRRPRHAQTGGDKTQAPDPHPNPLPKRERGQEAKRASVESVRVLGRERDVTRGDRTKVLITLTEGQNREIRRLMARLGFKVRRLQRVALGPITLKGLGSGQWRLLEGHEIDRLKRAAGMGRADAR